MSDTPSPVTETPVVQIEPPPLAEMRGLRLLLPRTTDPRRLRALTERAAHAGINALIVRVYRRGSTLWPSEAASRWRLPRLRQWLGGRDVLKHLARACQASGISLIAWLDLLPAADLSREGWSLLARRHWAWRMRRFTGSPHPVGVESDQVFLCPARREVRMFLGDVCCEVAERYPVEALWIEGLRFPLGAERPDDSLCFCPECRRRVVAETDLELREMPLSIEREEYRTWTEWRQDLLHKMLEEIVARARRVRPGLPVLGGVPAGWTPDPAHQVGLVDWPQWVSEGLVDLACTREYGDPGALTVKERSARLIDDFEAVAPNGRLAPVLPLSDLLEDEPPLQATMGQLPLSGHVWDAYDREITDIHWRRMREVHGPRPALVPEIDPLDSMQAVVGETAALTSENSALAVFLDDLNAVLQRGFGAFSDKQMDTLLEDLAQFEDLSARGEVPVDNMDRASRNLNWIQRQLVYLRERQLLTRAH